METVSVFCTDVHHPSEAGRLVGNLGNIVPAMRITFDLDDTDRVLRIEGRGIPTQKVKDYMRQQGYSCREMDY